MAIREIGREGARSSLFFVLLLLMGGALATAVGGCCASAPDSGGGGGGGSDESDQGDLSALHALESHFQNGRPYGEGPSAEAMARAVQDSVLADDAVAVKVIPGAPATIVALVRFHDLSDLENDERPQFIENVASTLDQEFGAGHAKLAVGIRGNFMYGAIGIREVGQQMQIRTGTRVPPRELGLAVAAAPGEMGTAALTLGTPVTGTLRADRDVSPDRYLLSVTERSPLTADLRATGPSGPAANGVMLTVCPGDTLHVHCEPETDIYEPLAPGTYTVFVEPDINCDLDANETCHRQDTPYTLSIRAGAGDEDEGEGE